MEIANRAFVSLLVFVIVLSACERRSFDFDSYYSYSLLNLPSVRPSSIDKIRIYGGRPGTRNCFLSTNELNSSDLVMELTSEIEIESFLRELHTTVPAPPFLKPDYTVPRLFHVVVWPKTSYKDTSLGYVQVLGYTNKHCFLKVWSESSSYAYNPNLYRWILSRLPVHSDNSISSVESSTSAGD